MVAVVGIDEGLFSADFRAREKLAQLLIQVAGRAGRADKPGTIVLQTHHPDHPLLRTLVHGGYHAFADDELAQREAAGFPPFAHLALLRAEARHADASMAFLHAAKALLQAADADGMAAGRGQLADSVDPIQINGPLPAPMPRRAGMHRMQLLLCAQERRHLHAALQAALPGYDRPRRARYAGRWSRSIDLY